MDFKLIREFCNHSTIVYVYSIRIDGKIYFCTLNSETERYAFYLLECTVISVYEDNLSLVQAKFKKNILLNMGGQLIECEQ